MASICVSFIGLMLLPGMFCMFKLADCHLKVLLDILVSAAFIESSMLGLIVRVTVRMKAHSCGGKSIRTTQS